MKDLTTRRQLNFFLARAIECVRVLSDMDGLIAQQMPFVSPSNDSRLMCSWEPIWKLAKSDTTAEEFVAYMTALNTHSRASPRSLEQQEPDFAFPIAVRPNCALGASELT